jgi:uracil-DNA glycosylase
MVDLSSIHESWKSLFKVLIDQPGFKQFQTFLSKYDDHHLCPNRHEVFNAFMIPVEDVKIVIVGTEPHIEKVHATGLGFGVREETRIDKFPLNFKAVYDRIEDLHPYDDMEIQFDQTLEYWRDSSNMLLLNRFLTCSPGKPGSHAHMWDSFTKAIAHNLSMKNPDMVWYLLGPKAQELKDEIVSGTIVKDNDPIAARFGNFVGKFDEISNLVPEIRFPWILPF